MFPQSNEGSMDVSYDRFEGVTEAKIRNDLASSLPRLIRKSLSHQLAAGDFSGVGQEYGGGICSTARLKLGTWEALPVLSIGIIGSYI
jgi:hypothetical protein